MSEALDPSIVRIKKETDDGPPITTYMDIARGKWVTVHNHDGFIVQVYDMREEPKGDAANV